MGKIIAVCNQKGGVGKTTTCVNLSAALGILENKILVIDTDPQANASLSFGFRSKKLNNPALQNMGFTSVIRNNIVKTKSPNVDLLPFLEDINLFTQNSLEDSKFEKAINSIKKSYDYIFIDCVPFFKKKNLEILMVSNSVLIPVQCDYYALEGLHKFLKTIRFVQKKLNSSLSVEGFLLTMYDDRLNLSKKVAGYMDRYFNDLVFKTSIHRNAKITQAPSFGQSILAYDINSIGARHYLQLAGEVVTRNIILKQQEENAIILQEERIFNSRKLSKVASSGSENDDLLEKVLSSAKKTRIKKEPSLLKNFDSLVNLSKSYIEKIMGPSYKKNIDNIWVYRINKSYFFRKKYLYIYFKNDYVSHYVTRWFSF